MTVAPKCSTALFIALSPCLCSWRVDVQSQVRSAFIILCTSRRAKSIQRQESETRRAAEIPEWGVDHGEQSCGGRMLKSCCKRRKELLGTVQWRVWMTEGSQVRVDEFMMYDGLEWVEQVHGAESLKPVKHQSCGCSLALASSDHRGSQNERCGNRPATPCHDTLPTRHFLRKWCVEAKRFPRSMPIPPRKLPHDPSTTNLISTTPGIVTVTTILLTTPPNPPPPFLKTLTSSGPSPPLRHVHLLYPRPLPFPSPSLQISLSLPPSHSPAALIVAHFASQPLLLSSTPLPSPSQHASLYVPPLQALVWRYCRMGIGSGSSE